ncbi:phosphotransferase family protein [Terricaulis sp.]|uniref:phosphotransferase family protein n=1 Tax=Terricaulis sp. TaxID=2768686 RepID=UPI0037847060
MVPEPPSVERLSKLAPVLAPGGAEVTAVRPLSGGASQELWSVTVTSPAGDVRAVLRRDPGRARSELSIPIALEAALIDAAHSAGVPSPRVLHVLMPEDALGAGFFMSHVDGEALGHRIVRDETFAAVRPLLARQCGEILARIHALPRPPGLPVTHALDVIAALERQHRAEDWPRPVFELAFRWLREHAPAPVAPSVVHGDFRTGNLLIGPSGVNAVLDWELAHAGDPMEDLGWLCVNSWRFGAIDNPVGGFGAREDLFAGYEAAGGAPVDRQRVRYWEVMGTLRWGVICTLSAIALREGVVGGVERAMIARRASETELDLLNLMGL